MLPETLLPYKHYSEEIISGVLDDVILPDDEDSENYPSEKTMDRWHHWLMANTTTINSTLKSVAFRELDYSFELLKSGVSLLNHLRESIPDGWLKVIIRFIYNSGEKLASVC